MSIAIYADTAGRHHWAESTSRHTLEQLDSGTWVLFDDTPDTPPPAPDPFAVKMDSVAADPTSAFSARQRAAFVAPGDGDTLGNQLTKAGVVLDVGATGQFDALRVESLVPFLDPESGRIAGVYTGYGLNGSSLEVGSVGLAYSDDGVHWYKAGQLIGGSGVVGSPDEAGCTAPVVVLDGGRYYLFRVGLTATGYEGGTKRLICSSTPSLTSPVWTHHGVMLAPGGTGWRQNAVWHPTFVRHGSLWYCFINATGSDNKERIGLATAPALTGPWTWDDANSPLFAAGAGDTLVGDPVVRKTPGGWRMDFFTAWGSGAGDWYTTTTDAAFPYGWTNHDPNDLTRATVLPGPTGSFDELYAHKPCLLTYGGRLFHYYTAVMAGDTNRRIALACDPPLPVGGATNGMVTPVIPGSFSQVRSTDTANDLYLTGGGAYTRLDGLPTARVQAKVGDLLDLRLAYVANNQAGDCRVDAVTLNGVGAVVNYISGTGSTGRGYLGWNVLGGRYDVGSGSTSYIVQATDVINGTVALVPVFRCDGDFRVIFNNSADKTFFSVRNLGPTL